MNKKSFISSFLIVGMLISNNIVYAGGVTNAEISNNTPKLQQIVASYNAKFVDMRGDTLLGYNKQTKVNEDITITTVLNRLKNEGYLPVEKQYLKYTSTFGRRGTLASEDTPVESIAIHTGLDIAAANIENSNAYNVLDGKVEKVIHGNTGYGNHVIIDHGEFRTYYAHLNKVENLVEGQPIKGGEKVGEVGNTGRSTGPHLHFEINIGYTAVDPEVFITYITKTSSVIAEVDNKVKESKVVVKEDVLPKATRGSSMMPKIEKTPEIQATPKVEKKVEPKVEAYELTLDPPVETKSSSEAVPFDFSKPKNAYSFEFDFQD